jgi:hypothetical protein
MAHRLTVKETGSGIRYALDNKPLFAGDLIALCLSGGWVTGRFEWNGDFATPPALHTSIELGAGKLHPLAIELPTGALVRRG